MLTLSYQTDAYWEVQVGFYAQFFFFLLSIAMILPLSRKEETSCASQNLGGEYWMPIGWYTFLSISRLNLFGHKTHKNRWTYIYIYLSDITVSSQSMGMKQASIPETMVNEFAKKVLHWKKQLIVELIVKKFLIAYNFSELTLNVS